MAEHILLCTSQIRSFLKSNLMTSFVYGEPWIRNSDFFVKMGGKVDKGRWCVNFQKTRQHVELDIQVISVIHSKTKGIPPCPLWKHWISHKSWPVFSQDVFIYSLFFFRVNPSYQLCSFLPADPELLRSEFLLPLGVWILYHESWKEIYRPDDVTPWGGITM